MRYRSFYIVRHGESEANARRYPAGMSDSRLTRKGHRQAQDKKDLVSWLHPYPTMIVASPLYRASRTARILNEALVLPIQYDRWLREQHYGTCQGSGKEKLRALHGPAWRDRAPGGETSGRFFRRVTGRIMYWLDRCGDKAVPMFVCHGGVIEAMARTAAGMDLRGAANCAVVRFDLAQRGGASCWNVTEITEEF